MQSETVQETKRKGECEVMHQGESERDRAKGEGRLGRGERCWGNVNL